MELVIGIAILILMVFEACVIAHYLAMAVKSRIEEQRRYDAEYEKFLRGLKVLDNFEKVYGPEVFLRH